MVENKSHPERPDTVAPDHPNGPVRVRVKDLLQGSKEAVLEHAGQEYRLRVTASGKLILTK